MYDVHVLPDNKVVVVFKQCEMPRSIRIWQNLGLRGILNISMQLKDQPFFNLSQLPSEVNTGFVQLSLSQIMPLQCLQRLALFCSQMSVKLTIKNQ